MKAAISMEREFVKEVCRVLEKQGLSHREFGKRLFETDDGPRQWAKVRNPTGEGKTRKLSLDECYKIAGILGIELPMLLLQTAIRNEENA
ncbi:hypothetical protein LN040_04040 [Desulfovibrio subterraneus]|nr:hypothetical protein [Desulfovibrio subterraneus]WBF68285.1 hypothetical protein LN040_04040 [Desulfovibrio subterraneus]